MAMERKLEKILQLAIDAQERTENFETMPNKEGIDKTVEEILKMLYMAVNDPNPSEKSFDKSELASRIHNLLLFRYDHLKGELKKIFQPKSSDNRSLSVDFSSSELKSDAVLDEVSEEREKLKKDCVSFEEHQILQGQLEDMKRRNNELQTLCEETSANIKKGETNQMVGSLRDENEVLREGNAEACSRIQDAKKVINELTLENVKQNQIQKAEKAEREKAELELKLVQEELRSQNSKLQAMEDLKAENESLALEIKTLKDEYSNSLADCERMKLELESKNKLYLEEITDNSTLTSKLREAEKIVEKLEEDVKKCKEEEERKIRTIESLRQERGFIEEQVGKLEVGISVLEEKNDHFLEQISEINEKLNELTNLSVMYR